MTTALQTRPSSLVDTIPVSISRVTVVQSGARDAYQVALALEEAGMLECLVTDLFWPSDRRWAQAVQKFLPSSLRSQVRARSEAGIPSARVRLMVWSGLSTLFVDKLSALGVVPQALRRFALRSGDGALGRNAGRFAQRNKSALLSYSYYAHDAFANFDGKGILFQLHPHPASMRRILTAELAAHPQCAASLQQEWELALPQSDFDHLVGEPAAATHIIAASSFTRSTLIENGIPHENVTVIPYGVDSGVFLPDCSRLAREGSKLRLLFVGRINQRKGIQYLLDSLKLLNTDQLELTICGRVVDDLAIFKPFGDRVVLRPNVSRAELIGAYQSADLFVFPSVAEGFGQVLLESLACGLPILSTTRTAAPDLIESGQQGFIVEPCQSATIADRIEWALTNRSELNKMRSDARRTAEQFTWRRFRRSLATTVSGYLSEDHSSSLPHLRTTQERVTVHAL